MSKNMLAKLERMKNFAQTNIENTSSFGGGRVFTVNTFLREFSS